MRRTDFFIADAGVFDQAGLNGRDIFRLRRELAASKTAESCYQD